MIRGKWLALGFMALANGCASPAPHDDDEGAVERGRALVADPLLSTTTTNTFSCATCHAFAPGDATSVKPGAPLAGTTLRPSFWNGQEDDLLDAINVCLSTFMLSSKPLRAEDRTSRALYAYLASLEPGDSVAQPFTIVDSILDLPRGDESQGAVTYAGACASCHGTRHRGEGRVGPTLPVLPEDALRLHAEYDGTGQRLIFIEKIRHGCFLGYGGQMPPFSREALTDADIANILEALGVLGG
jgi:thiosulfate dehydrogenase